MIIIDTAEKPYVFAMFDRLKISYEKKEIRIPAKCPKTPLRHIQGDLLCREGPMVDILINTTNFSTDRLACQECEHKSMRIGDFTNDSRSFIVERKRIDDFYASMADGRLYDQARKMYSYCSGIKVVILEGMGTNTYLEDSFKVFDKILEEDTTISPLQQLINLKPDKKEWILSMITDLATCEVILVQTWDLSETTLYIQRLSEGAGLDPKIRAVPKKVAGLSLDELILTVIPGIGKARAQNIIAEHGSFKKLGTNIRKMTKVEAEKYSITKKLKGLIG